MIILSILLLLISNAVNLRRDMAIIYNRIAIIALLYAILQSLVSFTLLSNGGIGIHGGLFHVTNITQVFHIFLYLVSILIIQLTSIYPRKLIIKKGVISVEDPYAVIGSGIIDYFPNIKLIKRILKIVLNTHGYDVIWNTKSLWGGSLNKAVSPPEEEDRLTWSAQSGLKSLLITNTVEEEHLKIIEYPEPEQIGKLLILWGKLPNSGDILKLLIPNLDEFFHGGWTNYSYMVISQKMALHLHCLKCIMSEIGKLNLYADELQTRKMDNRGSKSNITMFVKEQRVDGSYTNLNSYGLVLRCTLRGLERVTWAGICPNQILNKRLYSTNMGNTYSKIISRRLSRPNLSKKYGDIYSLNPWFITGFVDGDGSFSVSIAKKKSGTGWKIQPIFTIGLDPKDLDLLVQIKAYFKVGKIYTSTRGIVYYTVGSTKDIIKYILPHFDKYNLATLKLKDYLVFKEIVLLMKKGEHKSLPGLLKIFSLRAILNKGLPEFIKAEFPDIIPATTPEPEFKITTNLNPFWLSGFITAEGSFFISLYPTSLDKRKTGYTVSLIFNLSQHTRDLELLKRLVKYLGCGIIRESKSRGTSEWVITKSDDIKLKLIPFLKEYILSGVKHLDFERFSKASYLIENKMHLTSEGVELIKAIKDSMYKR